MFAVISTGGKQYRVEKGMVITVEKLSKNAGEEVSFDEVILAGEDGNLISKAGELKKVKVTGKVVNQFRGEKKISFKYKKRKNFRWKKGHRADLTRIVINDISLN